MLNPICDICKELNNGDNWVVRLSDDKESIEFNGHQNCIDNLYNEFKNVKDIHKLPVKKVLSILNLRR